MDKMKERLQAGAENCIKQYEAWRKKESDSEAREALRESIHELRKIASRLDIEMAVSERGEMSTKRIPIPSHKASKGDQKKSESHDQDDFQPQDLDGPENDNATKKPQVQRRRRTRQSKASEA